MKKFLQYLAFTASLISGVQAHAVLIDASVIIPDENILINFNGLDWVYAGPIGTGEWGPGNIEAPEYRAGEGWRYATETEWASRPDWTDFIIGGSVLNPESGFTDHSVYRFAAEYWSDFFHIDLSDAAAGLITNGLDIGSLEDTFETWYVRDTQGASVPEASSLFLLCFGLLGLAVIRLKSLK